MKGLLIRVPLFLLLIGFASCKKQEKTFRLLSADESGISFSNQLTPTSELNILTYLYYYNGGGVMIADVNNDGLNDIYFTSNQGSDKLFLNKGDLKFEDVTATAKITNDSGWTTGVTHVDINNDGLLDIYICKVGGYRTLDGVNLLFINEGISANGVPTFREDAAAYGLDLSTFSTQAAFFDYDLDGDLDMFLLTHSVHPNRSYGRGENRLVRDAAIGDHLLENRDGKFVDVTVESGIFQNRIGYGLGLAVGDLNLDGYPDIYIGNDFFENDYCYKNNGDKTFTDLITTDARIFGHTSHYSMGNSIADINNDGRYDILSVDMLPEDLPTLKSSGVEDAYPIYDQFLKNGYAPQFMQNTLHLNKADDVFTEVAFQAGIAATEWSWGVLACDMDMDGLKDLYITNGILGATNDMDYINFISQSHIQRQIESPTKDVLSDFVKHMPQKKVANYVYKNNGDVTFTNLTNEWFDNLPSFSNGSAYADLDNDGDLDLVVNNINDGAFVFQNRINDDGKLNFVSISFNGPSKNKFGIGATVAVYAGGLTIREQHFPVKSYLSSVANELVIGIGAQNTIDSIKITWPDRAVETLYKPSINTRVSVAYKNAAENLDTLNAQANRRYISVISSRLSFKHNESSSLDFDRNSLVPFALSNEGPGLAVADVNGDSLEDIFIGGAKMQPGALFIQQRDGKFLSDQNELFQVDEKSEDISQVFFDVDGDHDMDLVVVSGGNEFTGGEQLRPRLYINEDGTFRRDAEAFKDIAINASVVRTLDIDGDGDHDLAIGSNATPGKFGQASRNYLFKNSGRGVFVDVSEEFSTEFMNAGLINDIAIVDMNRDNLPDLVAVGDWMPVTIFVNTGKSFSVNRIEDSAGWWNCLQVEDFDQDGDNDIVAGNWGLNTRLRATSKEPVDMYIDDFDDNGTEETIITYFYNGRRTLLASKDELGKQLPSIKKRYLSYRDFANADLDEIFHADKLQSASKKSATMLASVYFKNNGDDFTAHVLPAATQHSSVNAMISEDFNLDGFKDLLLVGNDYEISTQLGRLDASHGVLLLNDRSGFFKEHIPQDFNIAGPAREIQKVIVNGVTEFVVSINNGQPIFLKKEMLNKR